MYTNPLGPNTIKQNKSPYGPLTYRLQNIKASPETQSTKGSTLFL